MDELIQLVRTYRLTGGLGERLRLAEDIFRLIEPDIRLFVFSHVTTDSAKDALQEILKGIATSLRNFKGDTAKEFWSWCYRIARNKLNDHYRDKATDRMTPVPPDELWQMMEVSAQDAPMSAEVRHDLEYVMGLLTESKLECYDYLLKFFIFGFNYSDIAEEGNITYDNARMRVGRCLDEAKSLVAQ